MATDRPNRYSWSGMLFFPLALLIAQAVVYVSTGWRDGFQDPALWALKRGFLRALPWTLALAMGTGWVLAAFHRKWLEKQAGVPLAGWPIAFALVRLFAHFPFYGFLILFQFIGSILGAIGMGLWARLTGPGRREPSPTGFQHSTSFWMLFGPLSGMKDTEGEALQVGLNRGTLAARAPVMFPVLLCLLFVWTGAEGEDSGERVDAFWLSLAGMVWLGDYLLLVWLNRPAWLRRE